MKNYLVNCVPNMERKANYQRRKLIESVFEPDPDQYLSFSLGNVSSEIEIKRDQLKSEFYVSDYDSPEVHAKRRELYASLYEVIPSALLLYRLICTFGCVEISCQGNQGYKMVWFYVLKHKPTNIKIAFSEWKGASIFHSTFDSYKQMPENLRNDLLELIDYILSDECAHPYDGLVAGSVA